jgi:hypothetical protein
VIDGVLSSLAPEIQSWERCSCFDEECGGNELKRGKGGAWEWVGGVRIDRGTVGSAGLPNGDVGRVRFTAGACESSIVPPRIWSREPQPELLRRREGTNVIASSES